MEKRKTTSGLKRSFNPLAHYKTPYGFADSGRRRFDGTPLWEDVPEERAVIQQMVEWRRNGLSASAIAHMLSERGVPTKTGKSQWGHQTVTNILAREPE